VIIFNTESRHLHEDNEEAVENIEDGHQLVTALEHSPECRRYISVLHIMNQATMDPQAQHSRTSDLRLNAIPKTSHK
jgi:hypothetical protein